jgi:hypothetical protein
MIGKMPGTMKFLITDKNGGEMTYKVTITDIDDNEAYTEEIEVDSLMDAGIVAEDIFEQYHQYCPCTHCTHNCHVDFIRMEGGT